MTWDTFHRRGEVLRAVLAHVDARRDGRLPMELPGVAETFGDEVALLGALQLRWHTRLGGTIERELANDPADPERAVLSAWRATAQDLAGLRAVLDAAAEHPHDDEVAASVAAARHKEWILLAAMSGKASPSSPTAVLVGRELEERARIGYRPAPPPVRTRGRHASDRGRRSLRSRVKAVLAA